jgi:arginyl-tRNA synthetase
MEELHADRIVYVVGAAQALHLNMVWGRGIPAPTCEPATRASRLALCALTLRVLVQGLDLLGLEAPERM